MKPGEVVRLKSGGPTMTVTGEGSTVNGIEHVACTWFAHDSGGAYSHEFPKAVLEVVAKRPIGFAGERSG